MTEEEFIEVSEKIRSVTGIHFPLSKKYFVESRLERRIADIGDKKNLSSSVDYMNYIIRGLDKEEREYFYQSITINETFFYRSEKQFQTLEEVIIPEIIENKKPFNNIKIWSAASSSGEEIFTLAIIIAERLSKLYPKVQFDLEGSDLDKEILKKADKGEYKKYSIRNIPQKELDKYFDKNNEVYTLKPIIKSKVSFKQANLNDSKSLRIFKGKDIVLLANVLIYFNQETKEKVLEDIYHLISKGGYLLVGYSESLQNIKHKFEVMTINKTIVYRKN